jgi:hypothetical protein
MEYVIFIGMKLKGGFYPNFETAQAQAKKLKGIINICGVQPLNGKLKIVTRQNFRND